MSTNCGGARSPPRAFQCGGRICTVSVAMSALDSNPTSTRGYARDSSDSSHAPDDAVVSIVGLAKRYRDVTAVDGVSFSLQRGTVTGFLGPNGAGKTTT